MLFVEPLKRSEMVQQLGVIGFALVKTASNGNEWINSTKVVSHDVDTIRSFWIPFLHPVIVSLPAGIAAAVVPHHAQSKLSSGRGYFFSSFSLVR